MEPHSLEGIDLPSLYWHDRKSGMRAIRGRMAFVAVPIGGFLERQNDWPSAYGQVGCARGRKCRVALLVWYRCNRKVSLKQKHEPCSNTFAWRAKLPNDLIIHKRMNVTRALSCFMAEVG